MSPGFVRLVRKLGKLNILRVGLKLEPQKGLFNALNSKVDRRIFAYSQITDLCTVHCLAKGPLRACIPLLSRLYYMSTPPGDLLGFVNNENQFLQNAASSC